MNELQSAIINKGQSLGWDMKLFDSSKFSAEQMLELFAGKLANIDITFFAYPEMKVETMEKIRISLSEMAGYIPSDEHITVLESISPESVIIKSLLQEVSCFMADALTSSAELRKSLETIEEVSAVEISDKMKQFMTIELLDKKRALITTNGNRFVYYVIETSNYTVFKNAGLTSLKLKKDAVK